MMGRRLASLRRPRASRGMTLLEVVLALSILAVIAVVLMGSLRVGVRAWEAGTRRADSQQEIRTLAELVTETLAGTYPYKGRIGTGLTRVVLFQGEPDLVRFVTAAPPLALEAPAAPFHAVTLERVEGDRLQVRERLVPAEEPFEEGTPAVISRSVTAFRLQYLDDKGAWQDRWDGPTLAALPAAVRVELTVKTRDRVETLPTFVVPIAVKAPA